MQQDTTDKYDFPRLVLAQQSAYMRALSEPKAGRKRTHWIWFVFPQVEGLGHSAMSQWYTRVECSRAVLSVADRSAHEIFGSPDDVKYRSSMTLFDVADAGSLYREAFNRFFGSKCDPATLAVLDRWRAAGASQPSARP